MLYNIMHRIYWDDCVHVYTLDNHLEIEEATWLMHQAKLDDFNNFSRNFSAEYWLVPVEGE